MKECEYPCAKCEKEKDCRYVKKYRDCESFCEWFHIKWKNIKKLFGVECVDSTLEEEECDNEDS